MFSNYRYFSSQLSVIASHLIVPVIILLGSGTLGLIFVILVLSSVVLHLNILM